jgi:hypothetical protein
MLLLLLLLLLLLVVRKLFGPQVQYARPIARRNQWLTWLPAKHCTHAAE